MKVKNSNFVDYVKIFCRSGKGGAGSAHFLRDKTTAKVGLMEVMAGTVEMLLLKEILKCGHYYI